MQVWALAYWYGSILVDEGDCTLADMLKALMGVLFGAMMSGQLQVCTCAFGSRRVLIYRIPFRAPPPPLPTTTSQH